MSNENPPRPDRARALERPGAPPIRSGTPADRRARRRLLRLHHRGTPSVRRHRRSVARERRSLPPRAGRGRLRADAAPGDLPHLRPLPERPSRRTRRAAGRALARSTTPRSSSTAAARDAIDVACKLARRHWQREGRTDKTIILSREFAYHGLHAYGTSIAGLDFNRDGYGTESLVPETARVSTYDIEAVERTVRSHRSAERSRRSWPSPSRAPAASSPPPPAIWRACSASAARWTSS